MYARILTGNRRPARAGNATDEMLPMRGLRVSFTNPSAIRQEGLASLTRVGRGPVPNLTYAVDIKLNNGL